MVSNKPPIPGSLHNYKYSIPEKKTSLRPSSSLQDLSAYRRVDIEEGDLSTGVEQISNVALPSSVLLNEIGSFSKEKSPQPTGISSTRKKWTRVLIILCCLLLFASISFGLQYLYSNWSRGPSKFFVVLDCGSTGTRVYVYEASVNHEKDDELPILLKSLPEGFVKGKSKNSRSGRAYNRMETEPGLDKLVRNISGLKKALKPLIQWAEKQIPLESHKTTSLFLYATAGVRRLPSSDSEWLLHNAWSVLKRSPFSCKKEWVKTITGMEEAYYGWISLNYHTRVLGSVPKKETFGALDLGGSSLQVTFEGKELQNDKTSLKLSIGRVNHHLSAYSLAGYGLNDAFDKSVTHLFKKLPQNTKPGKKFEIKHPCLQTGYKEKYACSNCALGNGTSPIPGRKLPVRLVGAPKWDECNALAKVAVNFSEWSVDSPAIDCELQPCALSQNLPRPTGQFYAMSGFYVVYRFFNLSTDANLDKILEKGREFCEKNWDVARKSVVPQPFIEQYCFRAPYVVLLLREGLHISDSNIIVDSGSITWTMGVALFEADKGFPIWGKFQSYEILRVRINPLIILGIICGSLLVLLFALSCIGNWWVPKWFRRCCLPIFRRNSVTSSSASVINIPAPFRFQRWSPISTGDGRGKMPLSPTVGERAQQRAFFDSGVQFTESALYSSSSSVAHSFSSGSLGQMQFDNNTLGSFWTPNRSQMRLQSRRSQSREDLNSSILDTKI